MGAITVPSETRPWEPSAVSSVKCPSRRSRLEDWCALRITCLNSPAVKRAAGVISQHRVGPKLQLPPQASGMVATSLALGTPERFATVFFEVCAELSYRLCLTSIALKRVQQQGVAETHPGSQRLTPRVRHCSRRPLSRSRCAVGRVFTRARGSRSKQPRASGGSKS